jgi:hypothetical protein
MTKKSLNHFITVNGNNPKYYYPIIFLLVKKSEKKSTEIFEKGQK